MAKPTQLPRWATGAGAKVTPEPTEGKKDLAWVASERPPESYLNWWMLRVYQWCVYLDGLTNEALTWAAKHTFSAGLASSVVPSGATDVVRKTELDAEVTARQSADSAEATLRASGDATAVHLTGAETVAGVKTFSSAPVFPAPSWGGFTANAFWTSGAGYWKDPFGVVHLKGSFSATGAASTVVALSTGGLPAGCRPLANRGVAANYQDTGAAVPVVPCMVIISADGQLACNIGSLTPAVGDVLYLDGISFVAEQ